MSPRKILHVDINSYFATMEQQAYPNLRGKPVGVAGKGRGERTVVAGASVEAKRYGVKSGMSTWEARQLCPQIILIAADYDRYIFSSKRIFALLERLSPTVDIFSIDEAFLELPSQENSELETLNTKQIRNFLNSNLGFVSKLGFRISDFPTTEDLDYLRAIIMALKIKRLIRETVGEYVSCSIGISYGKTLAKLASEMQKPDGLTVIRPEDFPKIAAVTPVGELCGIGYRLGPRLNRMGVFTVAELGAIPKETLTEVFGDYVGSWMHNIGNGIDTNLLRSFRQLPQEKSVGHSYTLPRDIHSVEEAKKVLLLLSERVGARLRRKGLVGRGISVYLRFHDRSGWGNSCRVQHHTSDGYEIYKIAKHLLTPLEGQLRPVRMVAVTVSELVRSSQITEPLFAKYRQTQTLVKAADTINNRYGELTLFRASLASIKQKIFRLPDGRNKRLYLPNITEINPFTKRPSG